MIEFGHVASLNSGQMLDMPMSMDSNSLVRLNQSQIKRAAKMLADVFHNEPVYVYFMPDENERRSRLHHHFALRLRHCISCGEAYATSPNLEAIAMWFPPDYSKLTLLKILQWGNISILPALFSSSGRNAISRQMSVNNYFNSLHAQINSSNQWFLSSIGVNSIYRKRGYASALLKPMLSRFEKEGVYCFLDTQKEENIPLYEHFGFRIVNEGFITGTTIKTWVMSTFK